MMATEDTSFKIEKLTAENYHSWKFNMKMYLIGKDLWEIVTGDEIILDDMSEAVNVKLKNVKIKRLLPFVWGFQQACKSTFVPRKRLKRYGKISRNISNRKHCQNCLLYTSPSPRDKRQSRMPSSA